MEAKIYKQSGRVARVFPQNGTDFTLRELQSIVGGYIELVRLGNGNVMVINEEAKGMMGTVINVSATRIAREHQAWTHAVRSGYRGGYDAGSNGLRP